MAMTASRYAAMTHMVEDESAPRLDARQKRLTKTTTAESRAVRMTSTNAVGTPAASRVVSSSRNTPGAKGPQGPRPPEFSSKRVVSDGSALSATTPRRTYLPNATSEPFLGLSARRKTAQYSTATTASSRNKAAVGPPRSDSLQQQQQQQQPDPFTIAPITRDRISSAQTTEGARTTLRDVSSQQRLDTSRATDGTPELTSHQSNTALRAAQLSMPRTQATATKRQSYIPSAPSFDRLNDILNSQSYENISPSQANGSKIGQPSLQTPRARVTSGIVRTASTKLPTRVGAPLPSTLREEVAARRPSRAQEMIKTTNKMQLQAPQPPQERRLSNSSAHSGGLLARTVSPTDTKRMRQSTGRRPRSPTPELTFGSRTTQQMVDVPQFDAAAFSPVRITPDYHISDALKSMSSRSSMSSSRTPASSAPSRPNAMNPMSRSSSTRSRTTQGSSGDKAEAVPPVPAIPRAYGSPKDIVGDAFFPDFGLEDLQLNDVSGYAARAQQSVREPQPSKLMAPAYAFAHHKDTTSNQSQHAARHLSHQNRLPPLNLQPLSDPTSARIASLTSPISDGTSEGGHTPPFRKSTKTPSTPLTASKATFSSNDPRFRYDLEPMPPLRSTTSYGEARFQGLSPEQSENSSPNLFSTPFSSTPQFQRADVSAAQSSTSIAADYILPDSPRRAKASRIDVESGSATAVTRSPIPKVFASAAARLSIKPSSGATAYATDATNPGKPRLVSIRSPSSGTPNTSSTSISRTQTDREMPLPTKNSSNPLSPVRKMLASRSSKNLLRSQASSPNLDAEIAATDEEMVKLATKKKEFEKAAREVDELYKRAKPRQALSASQACRSDDLNIFERGEIIDYKDIYFCGAKGAKKYVGDLALQAVNFGFDDDRGDYKIVIGDHLAYRYEIVDILGKGSFGQVVRCVDHKTGKLVAIKIIRNKKRFHQQALVEVNILQRLKDWDPNSDHSMLTFTQSFYFRGHLCISTELLSMNLYEFIKAHDFKGFSLRLIRRFTKQMLGSLCLLQGKNVIHCDLKPENILLAHPLKSEIKVIDFGSSCFETERVYTYIQSRFYRSPEVILGMTYGMPIDMWSLGCILAELFTGYPIFPGENEQEQLACIMEVFGPPEKHLVEQSTRKKLFFDSVGKPRMTVSSKGKRRRPSTKTLQQALKCDDEAFLDFITRCLRWDPERRLKPDEAMQHDFVTGVKRRPATTGNAVAASSPTKRHTFQTPLRIRPLPEAPAAKTSIGMPSSTSHSPVKGLATNRRHSTLTGTEQATRKGSAGSAVGSAQSQGLPRSVSSRPDMAAAAATMASRQR